MNLARTLINLDKASPKQILVVGDAMVDVYVQGRVEETCQEGCPKFIEEDRFTAPGGAANASRSLSQWKTKVVFPDTYPLVSRPTKTRFMVGDRCIFRYDIDKTEFSVDTRRIQLETMHYLPDSSAVLISDYDKRTLTPEFIREIATTCKQFAIPCVADCKRLPSVYDGCILKGNVEWSNRHKPNMMTPSMVITNGWDGPTVSSRTVITNRSRVPCVNHVGAGDCFAAHLALALAHGFSLAHAAAIAHSAGRVYVQHRHNRPPKPEEIAADMAGLF